MSSLHDYIPAYCIQLQPTLQSITSPSRITKPCLELVFSCIQETDDTCCSARQKSLYIGHTAKGADARKVFYLYTNTPKGTAVSCQGQGMYKGFIPHITPRFRMSACGSTGAGLWAPCAGTLIHGSRIPRDTKDREH